MTFGVANIWTEFYTKFKDVVDSAIQQQRHKHQSISSDDESMCEGSEVDTLDISGIEPIPEDDLPKYLQNLDTSFNMLVVDAAPTMLE